MERLSPSLLQSSRIRLLSSECEPVPRSLFQDILELLVGTSDFCVTFEDLTGFTFDSPEFALQLPFRQHCSQFCQQAKRGFGRGCFQSKRVCNRRAIAKGGAVGMCRFGLWEAMEPLRVRGKTLGVFYFGSVVLQEAEEDGRARIAVQGRVQGVDPTEQLALYESVARVKRAEWERHYQLFLHTVKLVGRLVEELSPPVVKDAQYTMTNQARLRRRQGTLSRKTIDFVAEHYARKCTLNEVALKLGCHPVHLSRTFKTEVGVAFHDYVHQVRITHAKRLLGTRHMNVTRVAYEVGYADSSHFCRVFKEHTGQTPVEFTKSNPSG